MDNKIEEKILAEVANLKTYVEDKVVTEVANLKTYMEDKVEKVIVEVVNLKMYVVEKVATKNELSESEDKIITHIDGFVKLHENLDTELAALRGKYERLEERIEVL